MRILGLSIGESASAAALLEDGHPVAAVQEERLTRQKNQGGFPSQAFAMLSAQAGKVDVIACCGDVPPELASFPARPLGAARALAAASYFLSPLDEAAVLVLDEARPATSPTLFHARNTTLEPVTSFKAQAAPTDLYAAMTQLLGFVPFADEYKVMGLAAYGAPVCKEEIFAGARAALLSRFSREDIACSMQRVMEESLLSLAAQARALTGARRLCLAGYGAHNIVANARLRSSALFKDLFIPFATDSAAAALGAAFLAYHEEAGAPRVPFEASPYLGPSFSDEQIEEALLSSGFSFEKLDRAEMLSRAAQFLKEEKILAWFQGAMEFGPRALGNRSLLASPQNSAVKDKLNARIKKREAFRPFAPAVLAEKASLYFDLPAESPFMLYAAQVRPAWRESLAAVTHIDGSARPQTVTREDNPLFYDLLSAFEARTGVPVLLNTSFNIQGEPIVCTPQDALRRLRETDIDALAMGSFWVLAPV